jgi:acetylornithine/succinyldiaminopimelate/putrescine aminotransferase
MPDNAEAAGFGPPVEAGEAPSSGSAPAGGSRPQTGSVFRAAEPTTVGLIEAFIDAGRPNMLFAGNYVNSESAKVGYLLSRLVGKGTDRHHRHLTFFGNSAMEALAGAFKLARHTSVRSKRDDGGRVLVADPTGQFEPLFNPLSATTARSLIPGVVFVDSVAEACQELTRHSWSAVALVRTREHSCARELLQEATARSTLRIIVNSELEPDDPNLFGKMPSGDVYVFGETLTGRQVPFGCFTMTRSAYSVWHNSRDSTVHTSTFGGNSVCLEVALQTLSRHGLVDAEDEDQFAQSDGDIAARLRLFRRYVNPHVAAGMEAFGFAFDVVDARGGRLTFADGRTVLDCAGGTGASFRGHNPRQVITGVLRCHDPSEDYFQHLTKTLSDLTGFDRAFPAVSGATAVDTAVIMAMLANSGRSRIVTFKGNYSGKSLPSLNLSKYGPESIETDRDAFRPYYHDVVYVDPFSRSAPEDLERILRAGDVALVWFEAIQGMQCERLPDRLIEVVSRLRESEGFLVGVDEVLTGAWRAGEHFLYHQDLLLRADVVSLAKPLSDMLLPMGTALTTEDVYRRAATFAPETVTMLESYYRCALSSHVAWNALEKVASPEWAESRSRLCQTLRDGLAQVAKGSPLFDGVAGEGTLLRLLPRRRWFPFNSRSSVGRIVELAVSELILERCGVLVAQLRFFPSIAGDAADVAQAMNLLAKGTKELTPVGVYRHSLTRLWQLARSNVRSAYRSRRSASSGS